MSLKNIPKCFIRTSYGTESFRCLYLVRDDKLYIGANGKSTLINEDIVEATYRLIKSTIPERISVAQETLSQLAAVEAPRSGAPLNGIYDFVHLSNDLCHFAFCHMRQNESKLTWRDAAVLDLTSSMNLLYNSVMGTEISKLFLEFVGSDSDLALFGHLTTLWRQATELEKRMVVHLIWLRAATFFCRRVAVHDILYFSQPMREKLEQHLDTVDHLLATCNVRICACWQDQPYRE